MTFPASLKEKVFMLDWHCRKSSMIFCTFMETFIGVFTNIFPVKNKQTNKHKQQTGSSIDRIEI